MDHQKLQTALDEIDANPDISNNAWLKFCEWLESFHDINIEPLMQFGTFFDFKKAIQEIPIELEEQVIDLWRKWSKASEVSR